MPDVEKNQLKQLLSYLLLRAGEEGQEIVGRVRLTKLLYLAEVEYVRWTTRRLTHLHWIFYHYGPYAMELEAEFRGLEFQEVRNADVGLHGWRIPPWAAGELPRFVEQLPPRATRIADDVCRRWATAPIGSLLDHVYFDTEPMLDADRGERLDFTGIDRPQATIRPTQRVSPELKARLANVSSPFAGEDWVAVESHVGPEEWDANLSALDLASVQEVLNER